MPGLVKKLLVFAAVDGLILQPAGGPRNNNFGCSALQIEYKSRRIYALHQISNLKHKNEASLEIHGVIGLLSVASYSFLISITQRQQVAQILGRPIFVVTGVAVIPLSSQTEASKVIKQAQLSLNDKAPEAIDAHSSDSDTDCSEGYTGENHEIDGSASPDSDIREPVNEVGIRSSIVEDVVQRRGRYGRFGTRWFSRKGLSRWSQGVGIRGQTDPAAAGSVTGTTNRDGDMIELDDFSARGCRAASLPKHLESLSPDDRTYELLPKLLRYTKMMFASRSFFYSYDYDITRKFCIADARTSRIPLYRLVDPLYFWNRHLMIPFIESGQHSFVLPLMQGFVGQQEFTVEGSTKGPDEKNSQTMSETPVLGDIAGDSISPSAAKGRKFLFTLISRRSVRRPGLRYLRRGVDDEGNTANAVETEQILSTPSWSPTDKVYSFLQLRGSIPLYFSQSPYYLKPTPVLRHSTEINQISFARHFSNIGSRYGKVQVVCLLDKHGVEVKLGETYESFARTLNRHGGINGSNLGFQWFDFHTECRGMKFENVRRLVDSLRETLDEMGDTVIQNSTILRSQEGIVRTNCMDCLDRTGVAQCAFGQHALEKQLREEGVCVDFHTNAATQWFNTLWADNGDAISKQYSSTAALKGDYTRTRKRDYRGALNDLGLTLSRYYNNIVNDYFSQACIDYLLGTVTIRVFDEFEMDLMSTDPGISVEKVRQNAIDTSCKIAISDESEELIGGWTFLSPHQPNTLRTLPFEQSVVLLTDAAVYCCRFDWDTDKVTSFERVDLRSITSINYGTYITSTLTEAQMDEKRNIGIMIAYRSDESNIMRINTRSLQSLFDSRSQPSMESGRDAPADEWDIYSLLKGPKRTIPRFMAFKVLPRANSTAINSQGTVEISEINSARAICEEIERAVMAEIGSGHVEKKSIVEEAEIISVADAHKRTGYLEHLVFDIKKLVWA